MTELGGNTWGKTAVRVSKILRQEERDEFVDLDVQVLLTGQVRDAYTRGDNSGVIPTDTMRNTVYGLAQDHLGGDLEAFALTLAHHFLDKEGIEEARVALEGRQWERVTGTGFRGGSAERRLARVEGGADDVRVTAGIGGLGVLKTTNSAFFGFPRDEFTILPDKEDRLLATTVTAEWIYSALPGDTTSTWDLVRSTILDRFFEDWSASVQHQGWLMANAVLEAVPEITEISFHLPNQHHLPFDLDRFGITDDGSVFQPTSEPFGDIRFSVRR